MSGVKEAAPSSSAVAALRVEPTASVAPGERPRTRRRGEVAAPAMPPRAVIALRGSGGLNRVQRTKPVDGDAVEARFRSLDAL